MSSRVYWQVLISSGEGKNRIRNAVIVPTGDDAEKMKLTEMKGAVLMLEEWTRKMYPERTDWVMYPPELRRFFRDE